MKFDGWRRQNTRHVAANNSLAMECCRLIRMKHMFRGSSESDEWADQKHFIVSMDVELIERYTRGQKDK